MHGGMGYSPTCIGARGIGLHALGQGYRPTALHALGQGVQAYMHWGSGKGQHAGGQGGGGGIGLHAVPINIRCQALFSRQHYPRRQETHPIPRARTDDGFAGIQS